MVRRVVSLAVVLTAVLAWVVPLPSPWVERAYSRGLYAAVQPHVTAWSNRVPFALFDLLVLAAAAAAVLAVVRFAGRLRRGGRIRAVGRFVLGLAAATAAIYLWFVIAWGFNYRREPIAAHLAIDAAAVTPQAVTALAAEAVRQVNRLHPDAHRQGFPAWHALPAVMGPAFAATVAHLAAGVRPQPGLPKWSLLSLYFPYAGVSGMTDPFALEILVDRTQLPFERAVVTAHEWAHLAGYADEAEAGFVGWLTCLHARTPEAYSGWLFAVLETMSALPRGEQAAIARALHAGPRADLAAIAARARRIRPALQSFSWRVYDRYLKANRVEDGVRSYSRVLVLLVGTRFKDGWIPVVRERLEGR